VPSLAAALRHVSSSSSFCFANCARPRAGAQRLPGLSRSVVRGANPECVPCAADNFRRVTVQPTGRIQEAGPSCKERWDFVRANYRYVPLPELASQRRPSACTRANRSASCRTVWPMLHDLRRVVCCAAIARPAPSRWRRDVYFAIGFFAHLCVRPCTGRATANHMLHIWDLPPSSHAECALRMDGVCCVLHFGAIAAVHFVPRNRAACQRRGHPLWCTHPDQAMPRTPTMHSA
jgi:hypothetical protein